MRVEGVLWKIVGFFDSVKTSFEFADTSCMAGTSNIDSSGIVGPVFPGFGGATGTEVLQPTPNAGKG